MALTLLTKPGRGWEGALVYFSEPPIFPPLPAVASDGPWALVRILWKVGSPSGTPAPLTRPQPGLGCPSPGQLAFAGGNVIKVVSPERICFKESKAQSVQGLRAAVAFPAALCRRPRAEQASWRTRSEAARGRREGEQNPVSGKWQGSAGLLGTRRPGRVASEGANHDRGESSRFISFLIAPGKGLNISANFSIIFCRSWAARVPGGLCNKTGWLKGMFLH